MWLGGLTYAIAHDCSLAHCGDNKPLDSTEFATTPQIDAYTKLPPTA